MENYSIEKIDTKGSLTVTFSVSVAKADGSFVNESMSVTKYRDVHPDLRTAFAPIPEMIKRLLEIPLVNCYGEKLVMEPHKIKFVDSEKYGPGVKFTLSLNGLGLSDEKIVISTPTYYKAAKLVHEDIHGKRGLNQLTQEEWQALESLKKEAFLYAYHNKCLQPTAEEAAAAAVNGGFDDEKEH